MMTRDDFDTILRTALTDAAHAAPADPDLADRLVRDAGTSRGHTRHWTAGLLMAAAVIALVIGIAALVHAVSDRHHGVPPAHSVVPTPHTSAPALPSFHAANLYYADADHGWALGDAACPSGRRATCPALLATADGGASWHALTVPAGLVSTFDFGSCGDNGDVHGPCVNRVSFATPSDGYLWSLHQLYWTTNGGRTWKHFVDHPYQWSGADRLIFVGGRVVRVAPIHECSSGCAGSVQSAPVGTADFTDTAPKSGPIGLFSSHLVAADGAGYLFAGGTETDASPGIFRTDDGEHWTLIARNVCGRASGPENDPFFADTSDAADDGAVIADCDGTGIRVAAPGSTHFSPPRRLPHPGNIEIEGGTSQRHIVAADISNAYGPGPVQTTFYLSADGGRHWRRTVTLPVAGASIGFGADGRGWALNASGDTRFVTTDGGATWRPAGFPS